MLKNHPKRFGSKTAASPKNVVNSTKNVHNYMILVFASPEKLLLQSFIWSSRSLFLSYRTNNNRFGILIEISINVLSWFSILNQVCWQSWKMCLKIGYFADIPVFLELKNVHCNYITEGKIKKAALYIVFYAFEDSKTLNVFILCQK